MKVKFRIRVQDNTSVVLTTTSQKVERAIQQTAQDARRYMQSLMRFETGSARPGEAPRAHTGLLRQLIEVTTTRRSFKLGPVIDQTIAQRWYTRRIPQQSKGKVPVEQRIVPVRGSVPALLEAGGFAERQRRYRSGRVYMTQLRYASFPYLKPTRKYAMQRFLQLLTR